MIKKEEFWKIPLENEGYSLLCGASLAAFLFDTTGALTVGANSVRPLLNKRISLATFLFDTTGAKRKVIKRETPKREFRALRSATNAPRRWIRATF